MELDAGGFSLALHGGKTDTANHWPKIQIRVDDIAKEREKFAAKGITMSEINRWNQRAWSEGQDPEGNVFQWWNR